MIDRVTVREVADDVGISIGSCHVIIPDVLCLELVAAKCIPELLNRERKLPSVKVAERSL